jgi:hypothetical protein
MSDWLHGILAVVRVVLCLLQMLSAARCSVETGELVLLNRRLEQHASCRGLFFRPSASVGVGLQNTFEGNVTSANPTVDPPLLFEQGAGGGFAVVCVRFTPRVFDAHHQGAQLAVERRGVVGDQVPLERLFGAARGGVAAQAAT